MRRNAFWAAIAAVAAAVCLGPSPASAQPTTVPIVSNRPAATLLLPYFEVDLNNTSGRTTQFTINNASATAILAHVTVWSDLAVPILAFNVYLTGYDLQTIDMRDILNGTLPRTASAGQDPGDTISPKGNDSQDINFASCTGILPPPQLPSIYPTYMQNALTGKFSNFQGGGCFGRVSPGLARGYVTIDTVNNCTLRFPGQNGYFQYGGTGDATNQNVMWGEYIYTNSGSPAQGGNGAPLVAIQADGNNPTTDTIGDYTFYARIDGFSAKDNREPLATNFVGRYLRNQTYAVVWRDPKVPQAPFACSSLPPWYPLGREGLDIFDEQEHVTVRAGSVNSPATTGIQFPAATQKVLIGGTAFSVPYASGMVYLNLNTKVLATASVLAPSGQPAFDPKADQSWVVMIRELQGGTFGNVGAAGGVVFRLDSATGAMHFTP